jgi:hypothetical protein
MKRIAVLATLVFLAAGAVYAQSESDPARFEVSVEKGLPSVLSGPELDEISNWVARFGWSPTKDFQLTASYTKWEALIAKDDILNEKFANQYNEQFAQAEQRVFRDAVLDQRDVEILMYEVGLTKFISLGSKRWESFIGIGIGISNSTADVTWTGAELRTGEPAVPVPSLHVEDNNAFMTAVRGGIRWIPVHWFAGEVNAKIVPIASIFDENINTLEVNAALVFRFGRFEK